MISTNRIAKVRKKPCCIFVRNTVCISLGSIIVLSGIANALNLVRIALILDYFLFAGVFVCRNVVSFFCR